MPTSMSMLHAGVDQRQGGFAPAKASGTELLYAFAAVS
jgi:hypothetical protein